MLHGQGRDFARLIRKSTMNTREDQEQSEKGEGYENEKEEDEERSGILFEREGAGLWGEKEADDVGRWLAQKLLS